MQSHKIMYFSKDVKCIFMIQIFMIQKVWLETYQFGVLISSGDEIFESLFFLFTYIIFRTIIKTVTYDFPYQLMIIMPYKKVKRDA